jgi:hypothetical protein
MSIPLLVPIQIREKNNEPLIVRSDQDYWRLMRTIATVALTVIAEHPQNYPIFVTQVLDESEE